MLRRLSLLVALVAFVGAPGGCDCGPEPVSEITCDFTVSTTGGDRIDFGTVVENGGTRSGTIVIKNTGTASLSALTATFGANASHYSVELPAGLSLIPDEDQSFVVVFAPTQRSILNSELTISHPDFGRDGCPSRTITLLGEGVDAPPADGGPDAGPDPDGGPVLDDAGFTDGGFIPTPDGGIDFDVNSEWRAYGGFEEARAGFAAVPLVDGTVLAIGGWGENGSVLDSIERFDPVTGRSRIVARMALPRAEPGAVALDDGRVAIVGGRSARSGGVVVRTVELFAVASNTVTCPGAQAVAGACSDNTRGFLGTGRIDPLVSAIGANEIVVALGRTVDSDVEVAFAGGDVVDITDGTLSPVTIAARTGEARLVDDDGSFLVVGGRNVGGTVLADTVRFNAATRTASAGPALPGARTNAGIVKLDDDRALIVGGENVAGAALAEPLLVDNTFGAAVFTPVTTTIAPRVSPSLAALPGDIVIIAGGLATGAGSDDDDSIVPLSSAEVLVPFGPGFARFAPDNELAQGRLGGAVVVAGDDDVVSYLGGFGTAPRKTPHPHAEQYRLFDNSFASFGLMGAGAAYVAAATPAGAAVIGIGGVDPHSGATSSRTRAFAAEDGTFIDTASLQAPRRDHSATSLAANLVVVIGGRDATGAVVGSASILDVNGVDTPLPVALRRPRANHTATLIADSAPAKILVCGGVGAGGELLDTCEIFTAPTNPANASTYASASFAIITTRLATGRVGHTATLLDTGEVLVVGGGDVERAQVAGDLVSVDGAGSVTRAGVPDRARRHHAAVALGGGRVLFVGGEVFEGALGPSRRAEVYVRASNSFVPVEDMETPRVQPAAFLLGDGNVLVAGGTRTLDEPGFPTISVIESELYVAGDTGIGTFEAIELPLSFGRSELVQADVFGRAVVVGGTHRDGVVRSGDERKSPQHFVDMLEPLAPATP